MIYKTLRKYPSLAFCLDGGFYLGSIILLYLVLQKVQLPLVYWPLTFNLMIPLFYFYKHFFRTSRNEQATSLSELGDIMRWLIAVIAISHMTIGVWAGTQSFPFKEQFLRPLWKEDKSIILNLISIYLLAFIFWQILYYLKIPLAQRKSKSRLKDIQKKSKKKESKMIRQEQPSDYQAIDKLIRDAFATAEHADGNEQDLVKAFRQGDSYIPELALVFEENQQIKGHILFTKAKVGQEQALVLAPLSIAPDCQKQGYGKALIEEGHRIAKAIGFDLILVLGSDLYYPKFGYLPAQSFGITIPEGFPPANFMAISLQGNQHFPGSVSFAKEFGLD